ncbi:MAG: aromatic hydrocarbon degradation protein, partial [Bacteroidota bacterium]|nr:aromatic hydrocarbon degradation protein [Bacteroidota bacterium]
QNVEYRAGINYDTGYLNIAGSDVSSYAVSVGLGLPVSRSGSKLNLMYSYGRNGKIANGLIRENIHSLSLNFSLDGIWFMKPKYN